MVKFRDTFNMGIGLSEIVIGLSLAFGVVPTGPPEVDTPLLIEYYGYGLTIVGVLLGASGLLGYFAERKYRNNNYEDINNG